MKKQLVGILLAGIVLSAFAMAALSYRSGPSGGSGEFAIYVAPGVVVKSAPCPWLTIHTDVPFSSAEHVEVTINGAIADPASVYRDDRGYLVVKLLFADVVSLLDPNATTATIILTLGADLVASETIPVKN